MEIDQQYLSTLIVVTGGNKEKPGIPDYLRGIRFLTGMPTARLGKREFWQYIAILTKYGIKTEINFWQSLLEKGTLAPLERQLLNHFRVYCVYLQFLRLCEIDPLDPLCREFCQELMKSYTKAKKAYTESQNW